MMLNLLWIPAAALGVWLGIQLLLMLVVLVQMLRLTLWPQRLVAGDAPPELPADQQASVQEVQALGFLPIRSAWVENGPYRHFALLFRHETEPAFASLLLMPAGMAGYPVSFVSHPAEGRSLLTVNRMAWLAMAQPPGQELQDAWAASLQDHWQAHRARIAGRAMKAVTDEQVVQGLADSYAEFLPLLQRQGCVKESQGTWHPRLGTAAQLAARWMRVRKKLAVPYLCAATDGPDHASYSTQSYLLTEAVLANRPSRHSLKGMVLVLSASLSMLAWGWAFSWQAALALMAILLLHEGGHALAMRAFGYRDMSMFFIPFLGAMVSGRPRELPAWKQAVVLLAGPVPGLLLGLGLFWWMLASPQPPGGFDWKMVASMAVFINLFNLLPLTPLDGGQLIELSLFSRWPRSRLLFAALSLCGLLAVSLWTRSVALGAFAVVLAFTLVQQQRIARLDRHWQDGAPLESQLRQLFGQARKLFGALGFLRHYPLVRAVVERRKIAPPRLWESLLVLALLLPLWGGVGYIALQRLPAFTVKAEEDTRSAQQRVFDEAYEAYTDSEDENGNEARLAALRQANDKLAADDPRRVDLRLALTWEMEGAERSGELQRLVAEGREGSWQDLEDIERQWLNAVHDQHREAVPSQRAAALAAAIARGEELLPKQPAGTIEARLRHAEQIDRGGDMQAAETLLAQIRHLAERSDDCRCELRRVLGAQAWYFMSHGRAADAVTVIEASPVGRELRTSNHDLSRTYAWALLEAGRVDQGIAQMRVASYAKPRRPSLMQRLGLAAGAQQRLWHPLDMAHALRKGSRPAEASALITAANKWQCGPYEEDEFAREQQEQAAPWEQLRERRLQETAKAVCPPVVKQETISPGQAPATGA
ncbi:hypothetical protein D0B54_09375 [Solimonas sp. K1W22B-7]|uniref:site-2 protease family protein n=1 Tax=Solimonas sp. K1W22B-7 TaxID=2303331 RepID=UPI000E331F41|nr:hypothetical protein D0B54_09375 [Solimonas sp. K1W22B-7]